MAKRLFINCTVFLYVLLYAYTAYNKLLDLGFIQKSLSEYPIVGHYPVFFSWAIPIAEIIAVVLLTIPALRMLGIVAATLLMSAFTGFIIYLFLSKSEMPCTCGGMISHLNWTQHLIVNSVFLIIGILSIILMKRDFRPTSQQLHLG